MNQEYKFVSRKLIYCLRTQNELTDLIPNIEAALPYVDKVIVLDGGSQDLTIPTMRNWESIEPKIHFEIDYWKDNFPAARNAYLKVAAEYANDNTWLATADPDEYYSPETWQNLNRILDYADKHDRNMVGLQCRSVSLRGSKRVWENLDEYWKHLLIKWDPNFHYVGALVHEGKAGIPHNIVDVRYSDTAPYLYEHRKQENIIWIRGQRNSFCGGGGPNLGKSNPIWTKARDLIRDLTGIDDWHKFYDYMLQGNIHPEIKQLMIDHMFEGTPMAGPNARSNKEWDGASEWREWYKSYFRILQIQEEPEEFRGVHIP